MTGVVFAALIRVADQLARREAVSHVMDHAAVFVAGFDVDHDAARFGGQPHHQAQLAVNACPQELRPFFERLTFVAKNRGDK